MRKWLVLALALVLCLSLFGCGKQDQKSGNGVGTVYADKDYGFQMEMPANGEKIVILHTTMGDISIRFFPEAAPKAVENFVTHAQNGYYNDLSFHRVIKDFMIQGGDPKGDGTGGESIWNRDFEDEFDQKLLNLRGSLSMANSGPATNGSQFFINQRGGTSFGKRDNYKTSAEDIAYLQTQYDAAVSQYGKAAVESVYGTFEEFLGKNVPLDYASVPDQVWDLYEKHGGNITLDGAYRRSGGHTVFGQVFKGMDVVDAIAAVETDSNDKPKTAVKIVSAEVTTYKG